MTRVAARAYLSPTLVLLAFDWSDGAGRADFLGFAIRRSPGFGGVAGSWLPNRLTFDGPAPGGHDSPSDRSPIQKFMWWDARFGDADRGRSFTYELFPVVGTPGEHRLVEQAGGTLRVRIPKPVTGSIGTYFNRAVVSSQAFVSEFGRSPTGATLDRALAWLANGLEAAIPDFLRTAQPVEGAIYHLTDPRWVIPALAARRVATELVYDATPKDGGTNDPAVHELDRVRFFPRRKARIMHDKFLVRRGRSEPERVLMGSANFTTEGLTTQANVVHTFHSPELAALYAERRQLLAGDPPLGEIAAHAGWSDEVAVDDARLRVFFPPEPKAERRSLDAVVDAVRAARHSVCFCLFAPTDAALRRAVFEAGDSGRMMFGLINKIVPPARGAPADAAAQAATEIYHRSRTSRDVYSHDLFPRGGEPQGFWWEVASLPGDAARFPVYIHHKFVVVDAETDDPAIFTGSANMSGNSLHYNDENLLEIRGDAALARTYLAEFMRLYEHYRARAQWNAWHAGRNETFRLSADARWAKAAFSAGTPQFRSRVALLGS